jgi:hypothetical protein
MHDMKTLSYHANYIIVTRVILRNAGFAINKLH